MKSVHFSERLLLALSIYDTVGELKSCPRRGDVIPVKTGIHKILVNDHTDHGFPPTRE